MSDYLEILKADPNFQLLLDNIKKQRPIIPAYDPNDDNTEVWKANSMIKQGFDLCLTLLGENDE